MSRAALVFPPQWDPRQPPLGLAVLAGSLRAAGADVRVFDLNLALYQRLLTPAVPGGIEEILKHRLLDPAGLADPPAYLRTSEELQRIFDSRLDPDGLSRLFWDTAGGPWSPASARDWQAVLTGRETPPAVRHLAPEITSLLDWNPDLIGLSVIADTQLGAALALAGRLRRARPGVRLVIGGDALTYRRSLLPALPWLREWVDVIGLGDGEPLLEALATLPAAPTVCPVSSTTGPGASGPALAVLATNPGPPSSSQPSPRPVPPGPLPNGLAWGADGAPAMGPTVLPDLGRLPPPAFDALPLADYLTPHLVMPLETARGCPWGRCAFCIHPVRAPTGRPLYRPTPLDVVAAHVRSLFEAGHRRFFVVDEAVPPPRLRALADLFAALPGPVSWIAYTRLDAGHDRAGFDRARASGCRKLFIGVETGSDRLLARFHKGVDAARSRRVLLDAAAAGLAVHFFLMTGFPGEEAADRQATIDLLADVWPAFDPFGISYDLFLLSGERDTDLLADPTAFGWEGPTPCPHQELAWQFPVAAGPAAAAAWSDFRRRLDDLADRVCGPAWGLRHAALAQDSLHLLLLEAHSSPPAG
ncbi:MAG: radical SAM protein [Candidatus Riflebacteria bacterium]|nr:radical SAM protein [Candidatus Riflebacteria bacterium]